MTMEMERRIPFNTRLSATGGSPDEALATLNNRVDSVLSILGIPFEDAEVEYGLDPLAENFEGEVVRWQAVAWLSGVLRV
jgi:hypothetical protein